MCYLISWLYGIRNLLIRSSRYILVTGTTGFIGAHVTDELLRRGHKVRGVARSAIKADQMIQARPQHHGRLDFVIIEDLAQPGVFDESAKDVDGIIHCASVSDNRLLIIIA